MAHVGAFLLVVFALLAQSCGPGPAPCVDVACYPVPITTWTDKGEAHVTTITSCACIRANPYLGR